MFLLPVYQPCCSFAAGFQAIFGLPLTETSVGMISSNMHDLPDRLHHLTCAMFDDLNLRDAAYACCTLCCESGRLR